jgi:hypothetical protein
MNNIKEFFALIQRYDSITIEEIEKVETTTPNPSPSLYDVGEWTARVLTGFGGGNTCSLCKAVNTNCDKCVYSVIGSEGCHDGTMHRTYFLIWEAETPTQLLYAFKERADAMRQFAFKNNIHLNTK